MGPLELLHAVVGRVAELTQLVERFEIEPSESVLREIAGELQNKKAKVQKITQLLLS